MAIIFWYDVENIIALIKKKTIFSFSDLKEKSF